jgi:hypothetical protein
MSRVPPRFNLWLTTKKPLKPASGHHTSILLHAQRIQPIAYFYRTPPQPNPECVRRDEQVAEWIATSEAVVFPQRSLDHAEHRFRHLFTGRYLLD